MTETYLERERGRTIDELRCRAENADARLAELEAENERLRTRMSIIQGIARVLMRSDGVQKWRKPDVQKIEDLSDAALRGTTE